MSEFGKFEPKFKYNPEKQSEQLELSLKGERLKEIEKEVEKMADAQRKPVDRGY